MLKFGIRQAGGCGRRPKNAKPTTKPNVQTQKKGSRPPKSPRGPPEARRHPAGARRLPGGPREAPAGLRGAPKPRRPQPFQGGLEIWDPPGRGCGRKPKNPKPRKRPEASRRPAAGPRASDTPKSLGGPEAPGRFRSSKGHNRKSPQPFRKIPKGYRSARDKTLDQSQADKGGSGNLGRQPETRKGIKLGGCLRKQGVGERNQFLVCCAREMRRRMICRPPTPLGVSGRHIYM